MKEDYFWTSWTSFTKTSKTISTKIGL